MNRRDYLASVSAMAVVPGCAGTLPGGRRGTPTVVTERHTDQFTATVSDVTNRVGEADDRSPDSDGELEASVTFDCASNTAVVDGWMGTSGCRTVAIESLNYDERLDRLSLVLIDEWNAKSDPGEVQCDAAVYDYEVRVDTEDTLPAEIHLAHDLRLSDTSSELTVDRDC